MIFQANSSGHTISTFAIGSRISSIIPCSIMSDHDFTTIQGLKISPNFVKRGFSNIDQKIPSACSSVEISSACNSNHSFFNISW
jgi:hypothetical protein